MYWLVYVLFLPFDLIKAGATQTETSLLKQYVAGERVDLLDEYCPTCTQPTQKRFYPISENQHRYKATLSVANQADAFFEVTMFRFIRQDPPPLPQEQDPP